MSGSLCGPRTRDSPTKKVWYYDLSDIKVTKKQPFSLAHFDDFFQQLPTRADTGRSWTVLIEDLKARNYDLKAVNPHAKDETDKRTPEELCAIIEEKQRDIADALARLRAL